MVLGINNTPSVMPEDLENLIQQGYQIIDVRENDEWDAGHYKSATHIPIGNIVENIDRLMVDKKSGGMKELQKFTKEIVDSEGNPGQII